MIAGLDTRRYTQPESAPLERELLFSCWQPACHVSDLPAPGTALRFDTAGRSAVLLRGSDGKLRALLNVCRHRGSRLVDGDPRTGLAFCVGGRLRCPYHGWEYDDAGALVHVPRSGAYPGLDAHAHGLGELAVETWLGFVFVAFAKPQRSVATVLEPIRAELEPYRCEALRRMGDPHVQRVQADWKLLVEHRLDTHHLGVARPLRKPQVTGRLQATRCCDDVVRLESDIVANEAGAWSSRAYGRWLPERQDLPQRRRRLWSLYFLWPNSAIAVSPDRVVLSRVLPAQQGQSLLRSVVYVPPDTSREWRLARYLHQRVARQAAAQDRRVVERVQQGLASGDATPGPIAEDETGVRWFVERMREAIPLAKLSRATARSGRRRT